MEPISRTHHLGTNLTLKLAVSTMTLVGWTFGALTLTAETALPVDSPAPSPSPVLLSSILCLPQATVQLLPPAPTSGTTPVASTNPNKAAATISAALALPGLEVCAPDVFVITYLAVSQVATVTLAYDPACAGMNVTVAPIDGGTINAAAGPKQLAVGIDGKVSFQFHAPAAPGFYNVVTTLGGFQRTLPFQVSMSVPAPGSN